ncbi:MAG: RdgB/HAM1 family non-canonical purine NTP pyrophosphatase [Salinisphaeraceae bacterium]|nr:RdgB/HAM1 family non-canonical purine NTP pyrophosphatase [Salinisphaeraceae bacterium]
MHLPEEVVLATGNRGKLAEMQAMLQPLGIRLQAQADLGVLEAEETGLSFVENALLKARNAAIHTGLPAIADDSGLEVASLQGAPGIYSARYAGPDASDADNNAELLANLSGLSAGERRARFVCVLVFIRHPEDPTPIICEGFWNGRILDAPRGEGGFGYDPLFLIPERNQTSAELPPEVKNEISHRGRAMRLLVEQLKKHYD